MEVDEETVMSGVRKHTQKLNQLKQTILLQQTMLIATLDRIKKLKFSENVQKDVAKRDASTETIKVETVRSSPIVPCIEDPGAANPVVDENICPLCGIHIPGRPEQFCDHVVSHYDNDDEPEINSFVHIP